MKYISFYIMFFLSFHVMSDELEFGGPFVRINPANNDLEVATKTYRNDNNRQVTLSGLIHVAKPDFFKTVARNTENVAVKVLYENLGCPLDWMKNSDAGSKRFFVALATPISWSKAVCAFDLSHQHEELNEIYRQDHFIHADVADLAVAETLEVKSLGQILKEKNIDKYVYLFLDRFWRMKKSEFDEENNQILCKTLATTAMCSNTDEKFFLSLASPYEYDIISFKNNILQSTYNTPHPFIQLERNRVALAKLDETIVNDDVIMFYGAGHMPGEFGFERHLEKRGFKLVKEDWYKAF